MTDQLMTEHTRNDIWNRLATQNEQINEIAKSQAGTDARLHALESAVDHGFKNISTDLARIAEKVNAPAPPPNYMALIVLALGVLGAFGGYSLLITGPIEEQAHRNEQYIRQLLDDRTEIAYMQGRQDMILERVQDIDNRGSRRWNSDREAPDAGTN